MRFHVVALPHTRSPFQWSGAAYTSKTDNFCLMMIRLGHTVFHYGSTEEPSPKCFTEHIPIITKPEQDMWFGGGREFKWESGEVYWKVTNFRAAAEITARKQDGDFLCLIGGECQKAISDLAGMITVEIGIGYPAGGTFAKYRVFESATHQALIYGRESADPSPSLYDAVIPAYFDVSKFPEPGPEGPSTKPSPTPHIRPLLYVGRITSRKGIGIAVQVSKASNRPLIIIGRGGRKGRKEGEENDSLVTQDGQSIPLHEGVSYIDHVTDEERNKFMRGAHAVLMPTTYMEPFGNVAVEAMLCGTPVITTNFGAFTETISHGVTGYRCHTLAQFVAAVGMVGELSRQEIRRVAVAQFGLERVAQMYEEYFSSLQQPWDYLPSATGGRHPNMLWLNPW